jgi:glucose-6-phosphate isomerase
MPVIKAMLDIWYSEFFNTRSFAVVPYSQSLDQLPDYLQQLSMESLGKRATRAGEATPTDTGAVIWGTPGTNGQHSYFQLLHQGTTVVPVDFIAIANSNAGIGAEQHDLLLSNCLAQSLALMEGKKTPKEPHRESPGNRPSNTWLLNELSPFALGSLLALFEHQVYVQSIIWDINAFDQWGVELGKTLAKSMQAALADPSRQQELDASSRGLIKQIKSWSKPQQS